MTVPADPDPAHAGSGSLDRLDEWEGCCAEDLAREWAVPEVEILRSVGSTNDVAKTLAADGAPECTVVLAERQDAGRGRAGRVWSSPPGLGLYLSVIARPDATKASIYPLRSAVAVAQALDPWTARKVAVKWPNDLLLHGRKLGGILCEATWKGGSIANLIVGVGVNVLHRTEDFPPQLRDGAVSLRSASGGPSDSTAVSRFQVASSVVRSICAMIRDRFTSQTSTEWRAELDRRDALVGERVDVFEPESGRLVIASGRAEGIAEDGALMIRQNGAVVSIRSGTIRFAGDRPA